MSEKLILAAVSAYYEEKLDQHGATFAGVDWKDAEGHQLRHRQFLRLIGPESDATVLDVGCGYGDFLSHLRACGHKGRYMGIDIAPSMIRAARERHGTGPDHAFVCAATPPEPADYAIASGVFNLVCGADHLAWANHVERTVAILAQSAHQGFGFNMLSLCSDPCHRRPDLHYADPAEVLSSTTSRYGRHVLLLQDYGLWEFTVLVRREGSVSPNGAATPPLCKL